MSKTLKHLMALTQVSDSSSELIAHFTGGDNDGRNIAKMFKQGSTPAEVSKGLRQLADRIDADDAT